MNDHKKLNLETDFGQRVSVERSSAPEGQAAEAAQRLLEIGLSLDPLPQFEGALEYLGSCAVHIFKSHTLDQAFFVTQHPLGNCSEPTADKAMSALRSDLMVAYGRKRATKRSGF